ncbi:MAG: transposase [Deltaproteobacteria bacterium]|nr:transposase [Deltaproteobacteria bacterium]
MEYRRAWQKGGCYFFTVVTHERHPILTIPENVDRLRAAFDHIRRKRPFEIDGIVILPDHIHCIWQLPEDDDDFPTRWRLIKHYFSRLCKGFDGAASSQSRQSKDEKAIWQRRYWEHLVRDEDDWQRHMDYIHYNPVKHGLVDSSAKWPHSSFRRCVERGWYSQDWGDMEPKIIKGMNLE